MRGKWSRLPTPEEEDRRRICRERKTLVGERVEHVNRIKGLLFAQGVSDYEPLKRNCRARLEGLKTGDGRPLPAGTWKAQISRELDRLELVLPQLKRGRGGTGCLAQAGERRVPRACGDAGAAEGGWDRNLRQYSGLKGFSAASATEGNWRPTLGWRSRHPGRADRSLTNRGSPRPAIRGCERR